MTGQRFDELAKSLGASSTRRSVLKAFAGTALGGLLMRGDRRDAGAANKRPACARLHEACSASTVCCSGAGTCVNGECCKTTNARCSDDSDCCASDGNVCRPSSPGDVLQVCLPPAAAGQACANDFDCEGELVCDPYSSTCGLGCVEDGGFCLADVDCCSGLCDFYTFTCAILTDSST